MDLKVTREPSQPWHMTDDLHAEHGKGDPFAAAMRATRMSMIITDPRQHDNPIVFANDAFLRLSGYDRDEVVGANCRFLQGVDTDPKSVALIREAIDSRKDISIDILNYRKDGTSFWNALFISPVSNEAGELQFYFASQMDVTDRKHSEHQLVADKDRFERAVQARTSQLNAALEAKTALIHEVDHRVKNNLQMVSSLILMQLRNIPDENIRQSLRTMLERIEALSTVHRRLYQSDDVSQFNVADFIRDLVTDLLAASGRCKLKADFELDPVVVSAQKAAPVALMINEIVTNSLKHAFGSVSNAEATGTIAIVLKEGPDGFSVEVRDNGAGMPAAGDTIANFGTKLLNSLARQLHSTIEWSDAKPGTRVRITIPDDTNSLRKVAGE